MAKATKKVSEAVASDSSTKVNLTALLSKRPEDKTFSIWIVGDTPLITHAWSEKARREMLEKQVKATKGGKEKRDPEADYVSSLYQMEKGVYGFPAMGIKNCIISAGHKDKGVAKTSIMSALWLNAEMVRTRPALAGAVCDMPLIRIWGSPPEMREDMVKIGAGLNKTANLAYRAQFTVWAMRVSGAFNSSVLTPEALAFLIQEAGRSAGIGEWRIERKGMFGAFHLATAEEEEAWDRFAEGKGPLPSAFADYQMAAE